LAQRFFFKSPLKSVIGYYFDEMILIVSR
jgi:hypothetical protein